MANFPEEALPRPRPRHTMTIPANFPKYSFQEALVDLACRPRLSTSLVDLPAALGKEVEDLGKFSEKFYKKPFFKKTRQTKKHDAKKHIHQFCKI